MHHADQGPAGQVTETLPQRERVESRPLPFERVGPYRLVRQIGRGGMSTVYLALRDDDAFVKEVAIKLARYGVDEDGGRRFRVERQVLARLDHPNISRVLDGGTTDDGIPYVVMEYVEGEQIDRFCNRRHLSVRERVELFSTVCEAVDHAHRNLVLHRDIKSSNIMVTADGTPKLLDFGIAKLLEPDPSTVEAAPTAFGLRPMTPAYASPEQICGEAMTTASDVYSLGVLLYELLTGHRPLRFPDTTPKAIELVVSTREPTVPSRQVREETSEGAVRVTRHPERWSRELKGDLDHIVLTALAKEPRHRYRSPAHVAEDLRRHLVGLPVTARPRTLRYRAGKFLRRHWLSVTVAAAFVTLLAGFSVVVALQSAAIAAERDQARIERQRAENIADFLLDVFAGADPTATESPTIDKLVDRGARRVEATFEDQPLLKATFMATLGRVYQGMGRFDDAERLISGARALRLEHLSPPHPDLLRSAVELGRLKLDQGDFVAAEALFREVVEMAPRVHQEEHRDLADGLHGLAATYSRRGEFEAAERHYRTALEIYRRLLGDYHNDTATCLNDLGLVHQAQGRSRQAESEMTEALEIVRRLLGESHPNVAIGLDNLGSVAHELGDLDKAERLKRESLELQRKLFGADHEHVAIVLGNLALVLGDKGDHAGAEQLQREALAINRAHFGEEHPRVANSLNALAYSLGKQGDLEAAEPIQREALEIRRRLLGENHHDVANSMQLLGSIYRRQGRFDPAEELLQGAVDTFRNTLGADHPSVGFSLLELGRLRMDQGSPELAEAPFRQAHEIFERRLGPEHWRTALAELELGLCFAARGEQERARPLLEKAYRLLAESHGESFEHTERARKALDDLGAGRLP